MATAQQHINAMVKLIDSVPYVSRRDTFADFVAMGAAAYSNKVDIQQSAKREAHYLKLIGKYQTKHQHIFGDLLGELVLAMDSEPGDVLGRLFHELDAANSATGQFFTPYHLCELVANLTIGDGSLIKAEIEERGFFRLSEPACGSAAMVVAFTQALRKMDINYQQHLHVTLTDIDVRACHMAYLHLSLLHVPAIIVHGNTLTLDEYSHWYTPAHVMGLFNGKLRRGYALDSSMGRRGVEAQMPEIEDLPITVEHLVISQAPKWSMTEQTTLF